jgi:predicted nucleic acid-binding protein
MYLLDTNVVSELRRLRPHGAVVAWLSFIPESELHISAVTIGEMQVGVELTRRNDAAKAAAIDRFLDQVVSDFAIVPMDAAMFRLWARLMQRKPVQLSGDAMIAATALVKGLKVATRNMKDFEPFEVETFNPFTLG